jgi:pyruvate,water dikinase
VRIRSLGRLLGRRRWRPVVVRPDTTAALSLSYLAFKDLITSNDEFLELVADIEQRLEGYTAFDTTYVRFRAVACATHVCRMVMCLDTLSSRRYPELDPVFGAIERQIEALLAAPRGTRSSAALIYPLSALDATLSDKVGGKAANAGELANKAHLPVPDGFAVSVDAFAALLAHAHLDHAIRARHTELNCEDVTRFNETSNDLQQLLTHCPVPQEIAAAILEGYDALCARVGFAPRVAVRSSAVGEDGEMSFAGQYTSVLNVGREELIDAYRQVLASLYSAPALFYRTARGIPDDVPMAVLCMMMVEAAASGIACSVNPGAPDSGTLLIAGSWGLGVPTAAGSVSPDSWEVSRDGLAISRAREGSKETSVEARAEGGVRWIGSAIRPAAAFCLSDPQVIELARLVLAAEAHYGSAQEVEWVLDSSGRFSIVQCRPLRIAEQSAWAGGDAATIVAGHRVLLTGVPASAGCASGPVCCLSESDDAGRFPPGAVLVARHSSPAYVRVMRRAAAIVTDIGAAAGHMASLAREFGVPAVLDTRVATATLRADQIVTVDARHGLVYEGAVSSLLAGRPAEPARTMKTTPVYGTLRRVADLIVPLNLLDPNAANFSPGACRTLHDIARFAHEKAFEQMFRMSDHVADVTQKAIRVSERLPFELYVIDIGGGLQPPAGESVTMAEVGSEPMLALLKGMTHPALRWWEPRRVSLAGFLSVATESMMSPQDDANVRRLGERSYAIVAEAYCNFSSRIGYHFAAVDAYCGQSPTRNYVSFRFKGGAADDLRRAKRCELIATILARLDFQVERRGDLVNARLRKFPRQVILDRLDQVGRLLVATRQLDMRMAPRAPVEWFVQAFLAGDYSFDHEEQPGRPTGAERGAP